MVVVEHDHGVRTDVAQPVAGVDIAVEEGLPVGLVLKLLEDGLADGRHVRGGDGADDLSHGALLRG
jgi:hypothetical protein